ncbi:hypothetical protein M0R45_005035 [Rubus argutus]|uniref:Uncharacterized protein n=1 Tax=Rubus argutus TaxID=59490 RepID=A0AAW1YLK2_RUBAR
MTKNLSDPLLAVGREDGTVDVINPINGAPRYHIPIVPHMAPKDDALIDLHLFAQKSFSYSSPYVLWANKMLTCTRNGFVSTFVLDESSQGYNHMSANRWRVNSKGDATLFCKVDEREDYLLFGGKPDVLGLWDLDREYWCWGGLPPTDKCDTDTWFTCATFLKDNHQSLVAGNNVHEVHFYDIRQKEPTMSVSFWANHNLDCWVPITSVAKDPDGKIIYIGNESGEIASVDVGTGKVIGCFEHMGRWDDNRFLRATNSKPMLRNPSKFIARHPVHPVIASGGECSSSYMAYYLHYLCLNSYLYIWNVNTRKILSTVYPMQHLTNVIFDSNFSGAQVSRKFSRHVRRRQLRRNSHGSRI